MQIKFSANEVATGRVAPASAAAWKEATALRDAVDKQVADLLSVGSQATTYDNDDLKCYRFPSTAAGVKNASLDVTQKRQGWSWAPEGSTRHYTADSTSNGVQSSWACHMFPKDSTGLRMVAAHVGGAIGFALAHVTKEIGPSMVAWAWKTAVDGPGDREYSVSHESATGTTNARAIFHADGSAEYITS